MKSLLFFTGLVRVRFLTLSLLAASVWCSQPLRAATVTFPDSHLEQAVREALGNPPGDITDTQMLTLTNLYAGSRGIGDTTGLEYAVNLQSLDLNFNP